MSELKPTAFRVFDNVEKRYVQDDHLTDEQAPAYVLADTGWLAIIYRKGGAKPADESRYTVERWTEVYDCKGKPIYEGDKLRGGYVVKYFPNEGEWGAQDETGQISPIVYPNADVVIGTIHDRSAEHG